MPSIRKKKTDPNVVMVKLNEVEVAFIDRIAGKAVGRFHAHGSTAALRRVALDVAVKNKMKFVALQIVPVIGLTPERYAELGVDEAPVVMDPKAAAATEPGQE
jgi:hypothetical protein